MSWRKKDQFKLTPEKLLEKITDKTKILVLPFPNNPTGAIMEKEELEEIVKIVLEKDLFVISDEIYSELTYNGKRHVTIASFPGMKERTVLINGFSKAYAMTGWRLGYRSDPQRSLRARARCTTSSLWVRLHPCRRPLWPVWRCPPAITKSCRPFTPKSVIIFWPDWTVWG